MTDVIEQDKIAIVRQIMSAGRFNDLYKLLLGISKYPLTFGVLKQMSEEEERPGRWRFFI